MSERPPAPDQAERDRIADELDQTLFVEAGAGSGKTSALVTRIVELVTTAGIELRSIAAITFTEKAAAELRDRVREALEKHSRDDPEDAEVCRRALGDLDGAAISTLHAFGQRLLREHPIEAGLPPRVEVLDEIGSQIAFDGRWERFREQLLVDEELAPTLLLALAAGITFDHLRQVASIFGDNWDLVEERVSRTADDPDTSGIDAVIDELERVVVRVEECTDGENRLARRLHELAEFVVRLREAPDDAEVLRLVQEDCPSCKVSGTGNRNDWPDIGSVRDEVVAIGERLDDWVQSVGEACITKVAGRIAGFTLAAADERRAEGRLEFHDLLVLSRRMLRDADAGPGVRRDLHERYQRILVDEFQDTDPIQVELAVLIAADPSTETGDWRAMPVPAGRAFFVGDPKQSIYRFRRADIGVFLDARDAFTDAPVELSANFRTTETMVRWVNEVFGRLIMATPRSQPAYQPLLAVRGDPPVGSAVSLLGAEAHEDGPDATEIRRREANDVVQSILAALDEGWSVGEQKDEGETWRPARLGDIAILLPARTSLPQLEDALEAAGIAYRTESSSLVYATRAVRDLVATARAIDDPTDQLSLLTALRSPLFGCGDDDLFRWRKEQGGSWNHQAPLPAEIDPSNPVAAAMTYLSERHRERAWLAPSELLERVVADRQLMASAFAGPRPADLWRRIRFVIDQARAWSESEAGGVRQWLRWVERQADEGGRVVEAVLPETDADSVRIMTIHAAKGLEFPIVILTGLSSAPMGRRGVDVRFSPDGGVSYRMAGLATADYERTQPVDEQMGFHERLRLLYVACTRARDHLVVSLHRKTRRNAPDSDGKYTNAELLFRVGDDVPEELWVPLEFGGSVEAPGQLFEELPELPPLDEWEAELAERLASGSRPRTVAATSLAPSVEVLLDDEGLAKAPRDVDLPPWNKGRYGTAIGRAVHGALQTVDLSTGDGLTEAVLAQTAAEGVLGMEETVEHLCRAALGSEVVREAAASKFWRETYVAVPVGDTTLEGYLDLLYRTDDGLVVVDYKTAGGAADETDLDRRMEHYRLQGGAYALAVEAATGEPVNRCVFVFLTEAGAIERELPDLGAVMDDVRELLASGEAGRQAQSAWEGGVELADEPPIDARGR
jgi:ATP-dependent exoDNAse (exonuclease V) beta subunit